MRSRAVVALLRSSPGCLGSSELGAPSMQSTAPVVEVDVQAVPISPRRFLTVGTHFRVKRNSGPLSRITHRVVANAQPANTALRLYVQGCGKKHRFYCEAVEERSGRVHTLYVRGPNFKSTQLPAVIVRPCHSRSSPRKEIA